MIGRPELAADPRFTTYDALGDNADEAVAILEQEFAARSVDEWRQVLADFDGQWAVVQDSLEVVHDPQVEANGYIVHATTREGQGRAAGGDPGAVRRRAIAHPSGTRVQRAR